MILGFVAIPAGSSHVVKNKNKMIAQTKPSWIMSTNKRELREAY